MIGMRQLALFWLLAGLQVTAAALAEEPPLTHAVDPGTIVVEYHLNIHQAPIQVTDKPARAMLINGQKQQHLLPQASPGDRIHLRLINAGASTYFNLHSADLEFEVISADGLAVDPVRVDEVLHAVAETYDIVVTVPDEGLAELRATAQDGSGFTSVFIGSGEKRLATDLPRPDLYMSHGDHQVGEMEAPAY